MIEIRCRNNAMSIKGHAMYDEYGKDIVCAAVSVLVATFANMYDVNVIEDEPCNMELEWKEADTAFLRTGLKLLENTYPDNVRIMTE